MEDVQNRYTAGIVAVVKGSRPVGSGFLIRLGARLYAVTCAHVLRSLGKKEGDRVSLHHFDPEIGKMQAVVRWQRGNEEVGSEDWTAKEDIAVLEVAVPFQLPATLLTLAEARSNQFYRGKKACWCFGYIQSRKGRGAFIENIACQEQVGQGFIQLTQMGKIKIEEGASGAPLCHTQRGRALLIGMIQSILDKDTAYLIPSRLILSVVRSLEGGHQ